MPFAPNIVFRMRWMIGIALLAIAAVVPATIARSGAELPATGSAPLAAAPLPSLTPALADLAVSKPGKRVEVIVQMTQGTKRSAATPLVSELGGRVTRDLHIINAVVATLPAAGARELAARAEVRAVTLNGAIKPQAKGDALSTSFNQSIQAPHLWNYYRGTGRGVGVAVIDTGIAGDLPDFRVSSADKRSRVIGSAVVNPDATTANDTYGHGTHVAGIIAGNSDSRDVGDSKKGRFSGVAPDANLVSIKVSDDDGNATVLDVIAGIQFADGPQGRVQHPRPQPVARVDGRPVLQDRPARRRGRGRLVRRHLRGRRRRQPRPGRRRRLTTRPATTPTSSPSAPSTTRAPRRSPTTLPATWSSRGTTQDGFPSPTSTRRAPRSSRPSRPARSTRRSASRASARTASTSARAAPRWPRRWSPAPPRSGSSSCRA